MTHRYDLIVVGAGPAGLAAAQAAGQHGLDVALLERKTEYELYHLGIDDKDVTIDQKFL